MFKKVEWFTGVPLDKLVDQEVAANYYGLPCIIWELSKHIVDVNDYLSKYGYEFDDSEPARYCGYVDAHKVAEIGITETEEFLRKYSNDELAYLISKMAHYIKMHHAIIEEEEAKESGSPEKQEGNGYGTSDFWRGKYISLFETFSADRKELERMDKKYSWKKSFEEYADAGDGTYGFIDEDGDNYYGIRIDSRTYITGLQEYEDGTRYPDFKTFSADASVKNKFVKWRKIHNYIDNVPEEPKDVRDELSEILEKIEANTDDPFLNDDVVDQWRELHEVVLKALETVDK